MFRYVIHPFKVMSLYCLLIVHSIAIPLCFYFEQVFAFKIAFDYSFNRSYLTSYMKERSILQGVLCLVGGVLSRGRYDLRLPRFLFFASRWQNAATILAGIVQAPQVWPLCILKREQLKLPISFVLIKKLNIQKIIKETQCGCEINHLWVPSVTSLMEKFTFTTTAEKVFQISSRPSALKSIESVRSNVVSIETSLDRPQRQVRSKPRFR